jgi:hypothetical protein
MRMYIFGLDTVVSPSGGAVWKQLASVYQYELIDSKYSPHYPLYMIVWKLWIIIFPLNGAHSMTKRYEEKNIK